MMRMPSTPPKTSLFTISASIPRPAIPAVPTFLMSTPRALAPLISTRVALPSGSRRPPATTWATLIAVLIGIPCGSVWTRSVSIAAAANGWPAIVSHSIALLPSRARKTSAANETVNDESGTMRRQSRTTARYRPRRTAACRPSVRDGRGSAAVFRLDLLPITWQHARSESDCSACVRRVIQHRIELFHTTHGDHGSLRFGATMYALSSAPAISVIVKPAISRTCCPRTPQAQRPLPSMFPPGIPTAQSAVTQSLSSAASQGDVGGPLKTPFRTCTDVYVSRSLRMPWRQAATNVTTTLGGAGRDGRRVLRGSAPRSEGENAGCAVPTTAAHARTTTITPMYRIQAFSPSFRPPELVCVCQWSGNRIQLSADVHETGLRRRDSDYDLSITANAARRVACSSRYPRPGRNKVAVHPTRVLRASRCRGCLRLAQD